MATAYPYEENAYTSLLETRSVRLRNVRSVPYRVIEIDLQNKPDWYHLVNPQLKVPALRIPDGTILIESMVIAEYIADKYPESNLLPTNALERAQLRLAIELFSTRIIRAHLPEFSNELARQWERPSGKNGPFWFGDQFGYVEVVTTSFAGLLLAPAHYRGFSVPETDEYAGIPQVVQGGFDPPWIPRGQA
ncbi:hypothetical protein DL89DRAFT_255496 [Linderina pennispora]|uniref:GST N-terminal domain-containing protein n=1 Tax=Linderina pennispora TaxID=61395 RepID=A0A1Y1WIN6_9FUNG|nr:uncharacterized protein DL89DRAFT_255496 [Linderina pennispora]ORX73399.1 hypothetical protein DL89DRAFT_255496 [Linderina pennispora]